MVRIYNGLIYFPTLRAYLMEWKSYLSKIFILTMPQKYNHAFDIDLLVRLYKHLYTTHFKDSCVLKSSYPVMLEQMA